MPFASKMVKLHGRLLLDGGIVDSIPVQKALDDGCKKLVVVLTQPKGFRKKPITFKRLAKTKYRNYPRLCRAILNRHILYNRQLDKVEALEAEGSAFAFRPAEKLSISRTEKNREKFKEAFDRGYAHCTEVMEDLKEFIA